MDSFRKGFSTFAESVVDFGSNVQQNLQPFAQRTRQQLTEKIVGSEDTTALPEDYVALEKSYDEIMPANQSLLKILSVYESEGYDYPPTLRDTLGSTYKSLYDRIVGIKQATSPGEAGNIVLSGTAEYNAQRAQEPRTLHHALGRALEALSATLTGEGRSNISSALSEVGSAEHYIGSAQQEQDREIIKLSTSLRVLLQQTQESVTKARKHVHNTRLDLDIKKSHLRSAQTDAPNLPSLESEVERAEDEFVAAIEESSTLMKAAISTTTYKPVQASMLLIKAQRDYHRRAAEHLDKLLPELEKKEAAARDADLPRADGEETA